MEWSDYRAVLFDLDGVITPTADVHMRAWERMFNEFLRARDPQSAPYTADDYFQYVDGKPRLDGVRSFLASREIVLPEGEPDDPPEADTVAGLGHRKNAFFTGVLRDEGVEAYPGSVALLDALADTDLVLGVVSSSRNAPAVLEAAGLADRFAFVVDGNVAVAQDLAGKPAPDTFEYGAQLAGTTPAASVVVEDAVSGVAAGRAGDFGLVVGVDRGAGAQNLIDNGADIAVADLKELI
ncbi:HAD-IA family hydrolase [Epidermidibacterium keratini]|uniref:HAD-IA family hydrolase n=1 Tax=Epidermidibacterium keratini TaxID=1891644 RepID=A0A7L4YJE8_9ACTN|nr:HAD-IA family hydrolase [Epidermidibacterium keratini]QHB98958.1 HAD-IA family hydrolase [Epidermidibacterium keratini]